MKKILFFIIALLVICVAAMPLVVKNQVEKQIADEKLTLNKNGVELIITKEQGYISSFREFELKIVNGKKFRDFIFTKFSHNNPNYKKLINILKEQSARDIRPALDGTTFRGILKNSNLLLNAPTIELSLTKFSDEIMFSFNSNSDIDSFFQSILDEKIFTFYVTLDSNQQISQIIMKDIDKDIKDGREIINVKLLNNKLDIDMEKSLKVNYTLEEQSIKADDFLVKTKGIEYNLDYLNQFENEGSLHVKSFEFRAEDSLSNSVFKIGDIDISNSIKISKQTALDANINYTVKDIYFTEKEKVELEDFAFNINLSGLDKDSVMIGTEAYNELTLEPTKKSMDKLKKSIEKIINLGFKANIASSLKSINFNNKSFGSSEFTLNLKVEANTYDINNDDFINSFFIDGRFVADEKSINEIVSIDPGLQEFTRLGKKEGKNVLFDYEFKNAKLYINGTKIK